MTATRNIAKRALLNLARFQAVLFVLLFVPAWSLAYWQGWLYWSNFLVLCLAMTFYFLRRDPALIARRLRAGPIAEKQASQKIIQSFTIALVLTTFIVSALDYRFGWLPVPWPAAIAGNALVVLGFAIMFFVFRENSFASSIIEVTDSQKVVSTGPYALVRHPMYAGAAVMFLGTPLALGSLWGLVPVALLVGAMIWRLLDEETFLVRHLPDYDTYRNTVRWRLIPGVW